VLAGPAEPASAKQRKSPLPVILVLAIILAAAAGGFYWFKLRPAEQPAPVAESPTPQAVTPAVAPSSNSAPVVAVAAPPPDPWHGLTAGPIVLEKASEGDLVYAVGKLHNASDRQRFGVKVELDVFDDTGRKLGTATDYTQFIDPGKDWKFRALVIDRAAKSAKVASILED
jgi:hypothetical protein